jgi:integrase
MDRDLSKLVVPLGGALRATGDPFEPFQLLDPEDAVVGAVSAYLRELQACGRPATTQRSYAMDLLRYFRFLWAVGVPWNEATRAEARDFCTWAQLVDKPAPFRRGPGREGPLAVGRPGRTSSGQGAPNALTGKKAAGRKYAPASLAHAETVVRSFYEFHVEMGTGPIVNPFPLDRRRRGRANAHHNPMELWRAASRGRYRPRTPERAPRQIPDEHFDALFAGLSSHRDRALVAFFCSSGARAAELLGANCGDVDPGAQLITVVRKGSRELQQLPASPDAFVWLRLYQAQMEGLVSVARDEPLWWTLRRPFRRLNYHAARPCSPARTQLWAPTGLCTTSVTPLLTEWRGTQTCRSATSNGCSGMPSSPRPNFMCGHRPKMSLPRFALTTTDAVSRWTLRRRLPIEPSPSLCCSTGPPR